MQTEAAHDPRRASVTLLVARGRMAADGTGTRAFSDDLTETTGWMLSTGLQETSVLRSSQTQTHGRTCHRSSGQRSADLYLTTTQQAGAADVFESKTKGSHSAEI